MEEEVNKLHQAALKLIEALMDLNPREGSPEFNLLKGMAAAVDEFERAEFCFKKRCDKCGQEMEPTPEAEMRKEWEETYKPLTETGVFRPEENAVICCDCHKAALEWMKKKTPEQLKEMEREWREKSR